MPYWRTLNTLFPPEWIREKAKETGMIERERKSTYRIDVLPFENKDVVEALIYTAILTLLISRRLLAEVRDTNPEYAHRIPRLRWTRTFAGMASTLIQLILKDAGIEKPLEKKLEIMVEMSVDPMCHDNALTTLGSKPGGC